MEDDKKKKLISETITGRRLTVGRTVRLALIALLCGAVFGTASGAAFYAVRSMAGNAAGNSTGNAAGNAGESLSGAGADDGERAEGAEAAAGSDESAEGAEAMADGDERAEGTEAMTGGAGGTAGSGEDDAYADGGTDDGGADGTDGSGDDDPAGGSIGAGDNGDSSGDNSDSSRDNNSAGNGNRGAGNANSSGNAGGNTGSEDSGSAEGSESGENTDEELDAHLQYILSAQGDAASAVRPFLAAVSMTSTENTWFDSTAESTSTYAGIIVSVDEQEILILTANRIGDSDSLKVTFADGSTAEAYVKQSSLEDDLLVLAVSASEGISEELPDTLQAAEFGTADNLTEGQYVMAAGAPLGVTGSYSFGSIGYISENETGVDREQDVFYADIEVDTDKCTFVFDYDARLIGIVSSAPGASGSINSHYARVISIDSIMNTVKSLMDGEKQPYVGIEGFGVTFDMKYNNIPEGVYVSNVAAESPAYEAGIKRGDIIVGIGDHSISDVEAYMTVLDGIEPGEQVTIHGRRGSVNSEYRSVEFELTAGER